MEFPLWAVFGLTSASLSAIFMLIQERLKVNGFAMAFWNKVGCALFTMPAAFYFGFPDNGMFYAIMFAAALLWVVSDVYFFEAIPKVGAGTVSRVLPVSIILSFFLWFLFDHALLQKYLSEPVKSVGVIATLFASVYFATRLRHCAVSWRAIRLLWFVIVASVAGPILMKLITQQSPVSQGPFAFVFCEALFMVACWVLWYFIRKPVPREVLFSKEAAKGGILVGAISGLMVASNFAAIHFVDNPALVPAVKFTDSIIILMFYRATGRKEDSDLIAGFGIIACAAAIIILKSMPAG